MAKPQEVTDATFEQQVLKAEGNVLVDFWAPWCGPCRFVAPVLEEIAQEKEGSLTILKLNIDENQRTAAQYNVMSIPTMILYKDGQPIKQVVGAKPVPLVEEALAVRLDLLGDDGAEERLGRTGVGGIEGEGVHPGLPPLLLPRVCPGGGVAFNGGRP